MKTINVLIILCILSVIGKIYAQQQTPIVETNSDKGIKLNINVGGHFSNMIGDVQKDDNLFLGIHNENGYFMRYNAYNLNAGGYSGLLPGYKLGLGITFDITKNFAWGFDLNYQTKGCLIPMKELIVSYYYITTYPVYTSSDEVKRFSASNFHSKIRLNYLVIPVKTEFKYKKFYCMQGIYIGVLLNAVNTTKFDYESQNFDLRYTPTSHYSRIDFGVFLNTGFCFPLSKRDFIKVGLVGEWNVSGIEGRGLLGGHYSFFSNQVLGIELKYEIKVK